MKKLSLLFAMVLIGASFLSAHGADFVTTKEGTFFFTSVKYGLKCCLIGKSTEGKDVKYNLCDIKAYSKSGEVFEKMPVYKNNLPTGEENFMKVISYRNGLKLYEYEYLSKTTNTMSRRYYVFNADKLVVEMDGTNRAGLTAFFDAR